MGGWGGGEGEWGGAGGGGEGVRIVGMARAAAGNINKAAALGTCHISIGRIVSDLRGLFLSAQVGRRIRYELSNCRSGGAVGREVVCCVKPP